MAPGRLLLRSVQPGSNYDYDDDFHEPGYPMEQHQSAGHDTTNADQVDSVANEEQSDQDTGSDSGGDVEADPSLADVSFGALAKAQESFESNPRKRKLAQREATESSEPKEVGRRTNDRLPKQPPPPRSSKHAPTVQSSRHAVPRRRVIFSPPPALKSRDPRFDPSVTAASNDYTASDRANKNYSFLTSYQAGEILDLKSQIKKARDPDAATELKRELMSLESRYRSAEAKMQERLLLQEHKRKESEAIQEGKKDKPYFLKKSQVKEAIKKERLEAMGKRARDKTERRRQKREKGKAARGMPRLRRENNAAGG